MVSQKLPTAHTIKTKMSLNRIVETSEPETTDNAHLMQTDSGPSHHIGGDSANSGDFHPASYNPRKVSAKSSPLSSIAQTPEHPTKIGSDFALWAAQYDISDGDSLPSDNDACGSYESDSPLLEKPKPGKSKNPLLIEYTLEMIIGRPSEKQQVDIKYEWKGEDITYTVPKAAYKELLATLRKELGFNPKAEDLEFVDEQGPRVRIRSAKKLQEVFMAYNTVKLGDHAIFAIVKK